MQQRTQQTTRSRTKKVLHLLLSILRQKHLAQHLVLRSHRSLKTARLCSLWRGGGIAIWLKIIPLAAKTLSFPFFFFFFFTCKYTYDKCSANDTLRCKQILVPALFRIHIIYNHNLADGRNISFRCRDR